MTGDSNPPPGTYPSGSAGDAPGQQFPHSPQPPQYEQGYAPPGQPHYADLAQQAQVPPPVLETPGKKSSPLPWILAVIFLVTSMGGFAWAIAMKSAADKKQQDLAQMQARISQLDSEISSLNKELEKAKGLTKEQQSTLARSKQIAEQMYETTLQAAKEMNQIINEFNNVVARFNAGDISGANAAINQANTNIERLKAQLAKYDELAADFEKTIGSV